MYAGQQSYMGALNGLILTNGFPLRFAIGKDTPIPYGMNALTADYLGSGSGSGDGTGSIINLGHTEADDTTTGGENAFPRRNGVGLATGADAKKGDTWIKLSSNNLTTILEEGDYLLIDYTEGLLGNEGTVNYDRSQRLYSNLLSNTGYNLGNKLEIRKIRKGFNIFPVVKQIDTLAAEWPAVTNYLYLTYGGTSNDISLTTEDSGIVVIGAGPYRIGSSVEFDWGTVNMVWGLQDNGEKNVVVVNCNPETVSTDYDICKRLYFEELTLERILDITEFESPKGVVTSVGGQVANNLTTKLSNNGVKIFGTKAEDVDMAENRSKFSQVLDRLHIMQPAWQAFTSITCLLYTSDAADE